MEKLISVIVPAYNVELWLPRCLDSILAQTYQNIQVIVIDDGSADATPEIVDEYANTDERVVAVHQANAGLIEVRNKGIALATGEFITFVDGDDAIERNMYEKLIKNAIEHDADISHCGMIFCFPDHNVAHYGTGKVVVQNHFEGLKDLLEGTFVEPSLGNKLYKASLLKDSCLDHKILNNEDLLRNFVAFGRAKKSVFEDFGGYLYFQREGSMSKDKESTVRVSRQVSRARKLIVDHAANEIYPYAMKSWLSSLVNAVNALAWNEEPEAKQYCRECRELLTKERRNFRYLIMRQRIAAWLIIVSPMLHRAVYRMYKGAV